MKAALRSALSAKAIENKIILVDDLSLPFPKTKEFLGSRPRSAYRTR